MTYAEQIVRRKYPDAQVKWNDFDVCWIGQKALSEFIDLTQHFEDVHVMPFGTDEEVKAYGAARRSVEEKAEDLAWESAAARIAALTETPKPESPEEYTDEKLKGLWLKPENLEVEE